MDTLCEKGYCVNCTAAENSDEALVSFETRVRIRLRYKTGKEFSSADQILFFEEHLHAYIYSGRALSVGHLQL